MEAGKPGMHENLTAIAERLSSNRHSRNPGLMASIEHHAAALRSRGEVQVLDVTSDPFSEINVWQEYFATGEVALIHSSASGAAPSEMPVQIMTSLSFGGSFWYEVATRVTPSMILSDGKVLSHYHQKEMFEYLFPVLAPGGVFVVEHSRGESRHALLAELEQVVKSGFSWPENQAQMSDFRAYCARNIQAIEHVGGAVIVRKRLFEQNRFTAVPLEDVASEIWQLDEPAVYARITPRIVGSPAIERRTEKLIEDCQDTVPPAAQVGRMKNVIVTEGGIIYTQDRLIVEESFINALHTSRRGPFFRVGQGKLYVSEAATAPRSSLTGESRAIIKQTWDANYGHWLVDTLPRVTNVVEQFPGEDFRYVLNGAATAAIKSLHAESLELFGISASSIDYVDRRPTLVENAVYATPMTRPPFIKSERSITNLEKLAVRAADLPSVDLAPEPKIYITRNRYPRRNLLNEDLILSQAEAAGYKVVAPEELSLREQIALFSSATHVVGNMGAAFSSLAFSPQRVKVLMLATEHMVHDYFLDITSHKNGQYWALQGHATDPSGGIGSDFTIDVDQFTQMFSDFDAS